ncbi:MAG: RNA polymerase sigma factor [Thermoguttaceae bacterium]|jgi:RNA polymerase sigma-70 factor (ECF subfamily)
MDQLGDQERFTQWVREHEKAVRGFLLAMVRRPEVADDLKQEVFCRAWQARGSYQEQGNGLAYLLKIADRLVCDRHRRPGPQKERNLDEEGWKRHEPHSRGWEPPEVAEMTEQARQLAVAMDRLSSVQQRILLLRYYGQLSFAEIADVTGCPLSTTLSHCRRGLETLRKHLA